MFKGRHYYTGKAKFIYWELCLDALSRKSKLLTLRLREKSVEKGGKDGKRKKMVSFSLSISEDRFFNVSDKRGVARVERPARRTAYGTVSSV